MLPNLKRQILSCLFFVTICSGLSIGAFAQNNSYDIIINRIDSLADMGLPKSALPEIDKLDALARKDKNNPGQIIAVIYRITFLSYLEENALNAIISQLKTDINKADYPVKPVLQSLLADMYWKYYQQNRWQFSQRTALLKPDEDITRWDLRTIINETSKLYQLSLKESEKEQATSISVLDGALIGDRATRYLRPTLYDFLLHRALTFYLGEEPDLVKPKNPFSLNESAFFDTSQAFSALAINSADTSSTVFKGLRLLQQATQFHLGKNNRAALADLNLKRLEFLSRKSGMPKKDPLYINALLKIASDFAFLPLSADALVLAGKHYQQKDSLVKAVALLEQAAKAYPESMGGKNAVIVLDEIKKKELLAKLEDVNLPGKPILSLVNYRNVRDVKYTIYKLSTTKLEEYNKIVQQGGPKRKIQVLKYISKLQVVRARSLTLPETNDYNLHSAEFSMDALQAGYYIVLLQSSDDKDSLTTGITNFAVSRLSLVARTNADGRSELRVLDREDGRPLKGIDLKIELTSWDRPPILVKGVSDISGKYTFNVPERYDAVFTASRLKDTLPDNSLNRGGDIYKGVPGNNVDNKTILFTDRHIYRPGQTIYFKGLQLTVWNGKSTIVANADVEAELYDGNSKKLTSVKLRTNEFGSFNGSFQLPQSMLNGAIRLATSNGQLYLKVEEYKRPSFQVRFNPVKETYRLGDSVIVKGSVYAFSGYGLSGAKVSYRIVRSIPYMDYSLYGSRGRGTEEIESDTVKATNAGEFEIRFKARNDDPAISDLKYRYEITADVTDASGETRSDRATVAVGKKLVDLNVSLPVMLFKGDSVKAPLSIANLNGQLQPGSIELKVYSLKEPGRLFRNRLWELPDQLLMQRDEFKKQFPSYAWQKENQPQYWPVGPQVADLTLKTDTANQMALQLAAINFREPGLYRFEFNGRNLNGDTASVVRYMHMLSGETKHSGLNWAVTRRAAVKAGQDAEFYLGTGADDHILVEVFDGPRLLSAEWLETHGKLVKKTVRIPAGYSNNFNVQFLMVSDNRAFAKREKIAVSNKADIINVRLSSFRNVLEPGAKEQWSVQVTGNEQDAVEMLVSMYDESLDAVSGKADWQQQFYGSRGLPVYYPWHVYDFISETSTQYLVDTYKSYGLMWRNYEALNMYNYNYYGAYNYNYRNYLNAIENKKRLAANMESAYLRNAALVRNGFELSGKVTDDNGRKLVGASVKIKGLSIVVTTDGDGKYKIKVPLNGIVQVSSIGHISQEFGISKNTSLNVVLKRNQENVGKTNTVDYRNDAYGGLRIRGTSSLGMITVSAATSTIDQRDLSELRSVAIGQSLQGRMPGVDIKQETSSNSAGEPGLPAIRTNFNETAFFYPQLRTDEKGRITFEFTVPDALTRWKFRGLGHTKDLQYGYVEASVVTQKQLMINANAPRFFREGDTITVSARLANLTKDPVNARVELKLFNAITMQPLNLFTDSLQTGQLVAVAGNSNKAVSFRFFIPAGADALVYRLSARSGNFSDGEENTVPVLPNSMLVIESMPMLVRPGQTRSFSFQKFVGQSSTTLKSRALTLEFTQNPTWYAVQALPYLMEFPYECAEQTFSRYYANSMAAFLVNRQPVIKRVFEQWRNSSSTALLSNLEKNPELKALLLEETPWLRSAENESEQKRRIALLFDMNRMSNESSLNLAKLDGMQMANGGFPWFSGSRYADRYITQHILAGMGQLQKLGIEDSKDQKLKKIKQNTLKYLDGELIKDYRRLLEVGVPDADLNPLSIHAWYTRSYFTDAVIGPDLRPVFTEYLKKCTSQWKYRNVYEQGMIALTMMRYNKPEIMQMIVRSLGETAQRSDELGMYWAKNQSGYYWYQSPVETQALLIELFTEAGNKEKDVDEMKIWLLRNKQTNNWKTTKATAAACYALLIHGSDWLNAEDKAEISVGGRSLAVLKPDLAAETGTGYVKSSWTGGEVKPEFGKIEWKNTGKTINWGALHWQYSEKLDKITSSETNLKLERKYFILKETANGTALTEIGPANIPKTGDLLRVVVYLKADRDFEYVHLKDLRPAGTEPGNVPSGYKYQDGLFYYQMMKDVSANFFISSLPKGNYVFEYNLRVAQPGNFSTGISSIQCMYAPEFNAHSEGNRMQIK